MTSSKSNMAVIWMDIWDSQSGTKVKCLINRCFNVDQQIATVKIEEGRLDLFYFSFHFLFYFGFIFLFSIFRTTRVRVIGHAITSVTNMMA